MVKVFRLLANDKRMYFTWVYKKTKIKMLRYCDFKWMITYIQ